MNADERRLANPPVRKLLFSAVIPALAFVAYWPLRLAWADHLSRARDPETVARAVILAPGDADVLLKLSDLQQAAGMDATPALLSAAALDPRNASTWTRLGLAAEMLGDFPTAESRLLEAARASRQFAPRWALANYYFRRGDAERFWPWVRESLLIGYGDLNPVFQLCWHTSEDAGLIFTRAIPDRREALSAYVRFLMQEGRLATSEPVALKLATQATMEDQETLLLWCNRQLDAGAVPATVEVWNALCARRLIPYAPLKRDRTPLTDGDFGAEFGAAGFAWRVTPGTGVAIGRNRSPQYLWVAFDGDQPEWCAPLQQFVPVRPHASYLVRFEYHTSELPAASGLRWSAFDARSGIDLAIASPWLSSPDWKGGELRFTAPPGGLVRLALTCRRLPGATRIEGSAALRHVSIELMP